MPKHKITYILENFYPAHRAGTETYVLNLAKGMIGNGWQVTVIIASVGKPSEQYAYEGMKVYALSVPQRVSTAELNGLQTPSNMPEFQQTLQQIKPHVVHFHSFSRSFTHQHLKAAFEQGAKTIFTAHIGSIFCVRNDFQLFGQTQCNGKVTNYRCSACYASQKHNIAKAHIGALAAQISVLRQRKPALNLAGNKQQSMHYLQKYSHHNIAIARWIQKAFHINHITNTSLITQAINTAQFSVKKNHPTGSKITLGFIGRMNPSKGFYLLLEALKEQTDKYRLHCITIPDKSEPDYYQQMKQRFAQLGYTLWQENLTHQQINTAMDNWDVLVLPSHHEVAPLSILEAYTKRIPVLGSDYPAIAEMIRDGYNGWIFKNKDSHSLKQILEQLATNPQQIKTAAQNISPVKDITELVHQHLKLYHRFSKG